MARNVQKRPDQWEKDEKRGAAEDRRIQRTWQTLHNALISLVLERGYEAVTIKNVVDRANVGRSTFYAHYTSKEDLPTAEIEDLRATLVAEQRTALAGHSSVSARSLGFSRALFEHAQNYRDVYRALVGERGASIIITRMRALFTQLVREELSELLTRSAQDDIPRSAFIQFVVGSLMSILTWWLAGGSDLEPARVDAIFRRLTIPAIEAAAGKETPGVADTREGESPEAC